MNSSNRKLTILAIFLGLSLIAGFARAQEPSLRDEQKIAALALLWQEANYNFVFFDRVPDVNWEQTFKSFIPQVLATKSDIEFVRVLQRFAALLKEGHTNVVPATALWKRYAATPAIELDVIENRPVVVNVASSLAKEVPVGSVISSVDGIPVDRYLSEQVFPFVSASTDQSRLYKAVNGRGEPAVGLLVRELGTRINISFENPSGLTRSASVECLAPDAKIDWVETAESELKIFNLKWLPEGVAVIELNAFDRQEVLDAFQTNLRELAKAKAVIFDVRRNKGGNSGYGDVIGGHFTKTPVKATMSRSRENISSYRAFGKYKSHPQYKDYADGKSFTPNRGAIVAPAAPFLDIPVVVLIGSKTYSAAENFAALMSQIPGVKLMGTPTAGSTGQPLILKLENVAFAAITAKRDVLPDGTDFIGRGISPHITVNQTIEAFRNGRDLVLERAIFEL
ncbi:MAG: S41 family peptidase, partial [Pyrinomonadaceae bacterium]